MKYSIFHLQGGIGKHIAATAVAKTIKNNHPDRKLIVVCAYPEIFINLNFVDRVFTLGNTSYFYQEYIQDKDSIIFHHEPYYTTNHIHKRKKLIPTIINNYNKNKITTINSENLQINILSINSVLKTVNNIIFNKIKPGSYCLFSKFNKIKKILEDVNKELDKKIIIQYEGKEKISQVQKKIKNLNYLYFKENITKFIIKAIA